MVTSHAGAPVEPPDPIDRERDASGHEGCDDECAHRPDAGPPRPHDHVHDRCHTDGNTDMAASVLARHCVSAEEPYVDLIRHFPLIRLGAF